MVRMRQEWRKTLVRYLWIYRGWRDKYSIDKALKAKGLAQRKNRATD